MADWLDDPDGWIEDAEAWIVGVEAGEESPPSGLLWRQPRRSRTELRRGLEEEVLLL